MVSSVSVKNVCAAVLSAAMLAGVFFLGRETSKYESDPLNNSNAVGVVEVGSRKEILPNIAPSSIGEVSLDSKWKNDLNVVHVVNTRFMQHQAKLVQLSKARLDLFKTFTIPSMMKQTNKQFLWLIWVDPELNGSVREEFLAAVAQLGNVVVLGAEQVPETNLRTLYGNSENSLTWLRSVVIAGDVDLLASYYTASKTHLLLETVLDADDGLSQSFVESVQAEAAYAIGQDTEGDSSVAQSFCPAYHAEWRFYTPNQEQNDEGHLVHMNNRQFCIGSGVSFAYHVEAAPRRMDDVCGAHIEHPECRRRSLSAQGGRELGLPCTASDPETELCEPLQVIPDGAQSPIEDGTEDALAVEFECPAGSMVCEGRGDDGYFTESHLFDADDVTALIDELDGVSPINQIFNFQCRPDSCQTDVLFFEMWIQQMWDGVSYPDRDGDVKKFILDYVGVKDATQCKPGHDFLLDRDYMVTRSWMQNADGDDKFFEYNPSLQELFKNNLPFRTPGGTHVQESHLTAGIGKLSICVAPVSPPDDRFCRDTLRLLPEVVEGSVLPSAKPLEASVLLARTPTAAGMKHVLPGNQDNSDHGDINSVQTVIYGDVMNDSSDVFESAQNDAWESMEHNFGVNREEIKKLRGRFVDNMELILSEAFRGQCSAGHSCKESTKRALGYLMDRVHQ